jgi:hypothetical protein
MEHGLSHPLLGLDPLIAQAKRRARWRRLLALGLVALAAAAIGMTFALRSSSPPANAFGMCASTPSGWQEQSVPNFGSLPVPPTLVLTNFRFGRMSGFYGLDSFAHWPAGGVMVAVGVGDPSRDPAYHRRRSLRVTSRDFQTAFEETPSPLAYIATRSHGRLLNAYVEAGSVAPATIAAANQALAGVHACSA